MNNINNLNVDELKQMCKDNHITGYNYLNKNELKGFIKHHLSIKPVYYGILRIFSSKKICLMVKYKVTNAYYYKSARGKYYEYKKAIYGKYNYTNIKSSNILFKYDKVTEFKYKDYLVAYTLKKIKSEYGNKKLKFKPSYICDASSTIISMQKCIRRKLTNLSNNKYLNKENYVFYNRNIVDIIKCQSIWRSIMTRKNIINSNKYIEFIRDGYHIYSFNIEYRFKFKLDINFTNICYEIKFIIKNSLDVLYSITESFNDNIIKSVKNVSHINKYDEYHQCYSFKSMYGIIYIVPYTITIKFQPICDSKYLVIPSNTIHKILFIYIKNNYYKKLKPFHVLSDKTIDHIKNERFLLDICDANISIASICNDSMSSLNKNKLSVKDLYYTKLRLSYISLYLVKLCLYDNIISYDIIRLIIDKVLLSPRMWVNYLKNKWIKTVTIDFYDEIFKGLSGNDIIKLIKN